MSATAPVTIRERNITLAAVMVVFLLGALDSTIVSTAMPVIIAQLDGLELYAWVTTAYLLASTVMVPIYGKLSDMYGRKPILVVGIVLFLLGSMLSGLAGEFGDLPLLGSGMVQLVFFRALQGLGGAALFSSAFAIIADLIPASERGRYQGLFGGVFGLATVLGPLIGGFFTDHGTITIAGAVIEGWRWVFYVNLPLGLFSLYLITSWMPDLHFVKKPGRLDLPGAALIVTAFVPLLLALTWGGTTYPWTSARILGLLAVAAASLIGFVLVERRSANPILPLDLFRVPVFATANAASFVINVAFLGIVMFLPLFMQLVLGISATNSGFTLLPLMMGLILSSTAAGLIVTKVQRYKPIMLVGSAILVVGVFFLTQIDLQTTQFGLAWRMVVVGIGLGPAQSLFTLAIQNAVPMSQLGVATSASQFFRQIGSTIGLAVFGALLTYSVGVEIPRAAPFLPAAVLEQGFDLSALRPGAGESDDPIADAFDALYAQVELALGGDAAARDALLGDPLTPPQVTELLRTTEVLEEPARAGVLAALRTGLDQQAAVLGERLGEAVRVGFAASIRLLFQVSLAITVVGSLLILLVPELPLRTGFGPADGEPAEAGESPGSVVVARTQEAPAAAR